MFSTDPNRIGLLGKPPAVKHSFPSKSRQAYSLPMFPAGKCRYEAKQVWLYTTSNGNASETKSNESFDNSIFFNIEEKRTPSIVSKLFSKRSAHVRQKKNYFRCEANTFDGKTMVFKAKTNMFDSKKIIFEVKRTNQRERKFFLKRSERIRQKEYYFQSEANTLARKKIIFEAKRTHPSVRKLFSQGSKHIRQK